MRIFNANCINNVVSVNNSIVVDCPILGEGGNSSGYLIMSESDLFYLPKTTPDVKSLISLLENFSGKIEGLCDKISAITVTCSSPGSASSAPINANDFSTIKTQLSSIHSDLSTLKTLLK